jgi:hypothetical protein
MSPLFPIASFRNNASTSVALGVKRISTGRQSQLTRSKNENSRRRRHDGFVSKRRDRPYQAVRSKHWARRSASPYETLSEPLRHMLDGMTAIHHSWKAHAGRKPGDGSYMQFPRFEHPVVRVHPVTGRKLLFVDRGFTRRIVQLSQAESGALTSVKNERGR